MILTGNAIDITAMGEDNSLDFYSATNSATDGTGVWTPETIAGAGSAFSAPSMILAGSDVDVAVEGPDESLVYYWAYTGGDQWTSVDIAGQARPALGR